MTVIIRRVVAGSQAVSRSLFGARRGVVVVEAEAVVAVVEGHGWWRCGNNNINNEWDRYSDSRSSKICHKTYVAPVRPQIMKLSSRRLSRCAIQIFLRVFVGKYVRPILHK